MFSSYSLLAIFGLRLPFLSGAKSTLGLEGTRYRVAHVRIYPQYNPQNSGSPFDIALVRLAGRTPNIPFACLPAPGTPIRYGPCKVAGE